MKTVTAAGRTTRAYVSQSLIKTSKSTHGKCASKQSLKEINKAFEEAKLKMQS